MNSLQMPSLPMFKKANFLPNETREVSLSRGINSYIHEIVEFQKKNTNKVKTLSKLFWGNHPQRIRRGYSEKCCLRGCTKEELSIACLPYIDYENLKKEHQLWLRYTNHHRNYTNLIKIYFVYFTFSFFVLVVLVASLLWTTPECTCKYLTIFYGANRNLSIFFVAPDFS